MNFCEKLIFFILLLMVLVVSFFARGANWTHHLEKFLRIPGLSLRPPQRIHASFLAPYHWHSHSWTTLPITFRSKKALSDSRFRGTILRWVDFYARTTFCPKFTNSMNRHIVDIRKSLICPVYRVICVLRRKVNCWTKIPIIYFFAGHWSEATNPLSST